MNSTKAFETARRFFAACEAPAGWEGCREFVAEGATFTAQCEPLTDIHTIEAYCEWMARFGTVTVPGATYDLHAASFDEATRTAVFYATFHARHTGEGGPVPPTGKETHTHYVYVLTLNADDRIDRMVKVWNPSWALRELGWSS